jgi:hypothetical protein
MAKNMYYTLVASLPRLPYFDRADRAPITPLRLEQRLRMLESEDARQLDRARTLAGWRMVSERPKTDAERAAQWHIALQETQNPALREFIEFRMDQQTILSGLRRRHAGLGTHTGDPIWGAGRWVRRIEQHWDDPDFRLASMYPWVPEARACVEGNDAIGLERLLMNIVWRRLSRIAEGNLFGFEAVLAYVFKWDILQAWLVRNAEGGKKRFQELIKGVKHGH